MEGHDDREVEADLYDARIQEMRSEEYPMLKNTIYLDHAGTTLHAKSLIDRFSTDMIKNLYGNPHSFSNVSSNSARRIDDVRSHLLQFFNASPEHFDVVFVANASAGIKLVADAFRDCDGGFWYGCHSHAHTSLLGVRQMAAIEHCFSSDDDVLSWIGTGCAMPENAAKIGLFAYPAQSNFDGRRISLDWCSVVRNAARGAQLYTLLDAAALVSTSRLDFSDPSRAPDFTTMSLYKIFGFPDLGALIIRKASADVLRSRRYFGGGTVEMVTMGDAPWHSMKAETIHQRLEDGTLPIHSIVAVKHAIDVHEELFGGLEQVSQHCAYLADKLYQGLVSLKHGNDQPVCKIYKSATSNHSDTKTQGPIIAFNVYNSDGTWLSNAEVEKLTALKNICLRTGGVCNPGGVAAALEFSPEDMKRNFAAGQRCDNDNDVLEGKPTGVIRISFGAMSTMSDVRAFLNFVDEYLVDRTPASQRNTVIPKALMPRYYVEAITVFPIKSCAGYQVEAGIPWSILPEGLAWDREWCLVHAGTGNALNQKRYPRMALIRPMIDLRQGLLRITFADTSANLSSISLPLRRKSDELEVWVKACASPAKVCGDVVQTQTYSSPQITDFFTKALGVPCQLARFPPTDITASARHSKAHLQPFQQSAVLGTNSTAPRRHSQAHYANRPILLSNESPILVVSRSSLNRLNENIKANGGKAVSAEAFRANIVIAENRADPTSSEHPFAEDYWDKLKVGKEMFQMLGSCRRCQMVCVDQRTGLKRQEPFSTLAKTRRFEGKVFFGQHACHVPSERSEPDEQSTPTVVIGDTAVPIS